MESIIRGTTPTIKFKFSSVEVSAIAVAYLVIKVAGRAVLEKDITTADVGEDYIAWSLTQKDTFRLNVGNKVKIYCDWRMADGTRGRSKVRVYSIEETGKNEVI